MTTDLYRVNLEKLRQAHELENSSIDNRSDSVMSVVFLRQFTELLAHTAQYKLVLSDIEKDIRKTLLFN